MAIKIEFEVKERAIELPDGTILDIPERTKYNDEKIQEVLQRRTKEKEYNFLIEILEALFGRDGIEKISSDIQNENLDYLSLIYTTSVNIFYADKIEAEKKEMHRQFEQLGPLKDTLKAINPVMDKIKI